MKIAHIFKIVDAVYAVDRENLRQADACIVHGIPPLFAKMYLIFTIQEIGEKEKTDYDPDINSISKRDLEVRLNKKVKIFC